MNIRRIVIRHLQAGVCCLLGLATHGHAEPRVLIVDPSGKGDYQTLTDAVESLPMYVYERTTIRIRPGVYRERIRIDQDYVTLEGEDPENTRIEYGLPRPEWNQNPDAIGPGVVNLFGDDLILRNLTVENTQKDTGVHAFAVYGMGTRLILANSHLLSMGGDTVALWNYKTGMYSVFDCRIRGAVDFFCPRGWAYVANSEFFCTRETAALWHAGPYEKDQKLVFENCDFDGEVEFELGRHHYDAQFYFVDCQFSERMMDREIYRVRYRDPDKNRPDHWGHRVYFWNSETPGRKWTRNGLPHRVEPEEIDAAWTFDRRWNPVDDSPLKPAHLDLSESGKLILDFEETVTVCGKPEIVHKGTIFVYEQGAGSSRLVFLRKQETEDRDTGDFRMVKGRVLGNIATLSQRSLTSKALSDVRLQH